MKKVLFALVTLIFVSGSALAQNKQKIGHLNSGELMLLMPEYEAAADSSAKVQKQVQLQLGRLRDELGAEYQILQNMDEGADPTSFKFQAEKVQYLSDRIERYLDEKEKEILQLEQNLLTPIQEKLKAAIDEVAKEGGFAYIMDTATGALVYVEGGIDVMDLVKGKLGIPLDKQIPTGEEPGAGLSNPGAGG